MLKDTIMMDLVTLTLFKMPRKKRRTALENLETLKSQKLATIWPTGTKCQQAVELK